MAGKASDRLAFCFGKSVRPVSAKKLQRGQTLFREMAAKASDRLAFCFGKSVRPVSAKKLQRGQTLFGEMAAKASDRFQEKNHKGVRRFLRKKREMCQTGSIFAPSKNSLYMKRLVAAILALLFLSPALAQDVDVKKGKIVVDGKPIAAIDKKKKGFLDGSKYIISHSETGAELIVIDKQSLTPTLYPGDYRWNTLYLPTMNDSIEVPGKSIGEEVKIPLFGPNDESWAKLVVKYNLIKDGAINPEGVAKMKEKYPDGLSKKLIAAIESEKECLKQLNAQLPRDLTKPVTVAETARETSADGKTGTIRYNIMQGDVLLGTVVATGGAKSLGKEDAEYDYSSGILDLDGGAPLSYAIYNTTNCLLANYDPEKKSVYTFKNKTATGIRDLASKDDRKAVNSRLTYILAIARGLVANKYL
jgi:hypothetical protein